MKILIADDVGGTILLRSDLQEQQRFRGPGHAGALETTPNFGPRNCWGCN